MAVMLSGCFFAGSKAMDNAGGIDWKVQENADGSWSSHLLSWKEFDNLKVDVDKQKDSLSIGISADKVRSFKGSKYALEAIKEQAAVISEGLKFIEKYGAMIP